MSWFVPPFLIFLVGAPIVLALKGRARQVGLIVVATLALVDTLLMPEGTSWQVPFMEGQLTLLDANPLSLFTGYIFAIITFFAVLYAAAFAKPWMHLYAMLYAGTSMGAVFAGDWITLLIFWELMAVTSTLLVWEAGGEAVKAAYRYILFHGFGGAMLASGVALAYFDSCATACSLAIGPITGTWSSLFIVLGIGVNVAFIPLHTWLPDSYPRAHVAASVFLSVYTTKAAVYLLARTMSEATPWVEAVAIMGGIMAVYGVSFAVFQNNMRRLLSYHIVSQVGYMVAGVGLGASLGASLGAPVSVEGALAANGGMAHVFNHILYKALLFMTVGVIVWRTSQDNLDKLGGLFKKMPVTAITFWIAAFSISGVPGFNGFVSKGMVITAAEEHMLILWVLLEIASFGTFLSFLKLGYFAFLRKGDTQASDPPVVMQAGMIGAAILCVAIGVYPQMLFGVFPFTPDSGTVFSLYEPYTPMHVLETSLVLGAAAAVFFGVGRRVLAPHDTRLRDADALYVRMGRGIVGGCGYLYRGFTAIYAGATAAAKGLFALGRGAMRGEGRDVNWNLAGYGAAIVVILALLFLGVRL